MSASSDSISGQFAELTVPVVVDSVPRDSALDLARCVYFTITADAPDTSGVLRANAGTVIPFLMIGLQGIMYRPANSQDEEFTNPNLLDELIAAAEAQEGFSVEAEFLWLPTALLDSAFAAANSSETAVGANADRGNVFRVAQRLFTDAFQTARDGTQFHRFARRALNQSVGEGQNASLRYSPLETTAFREWSVRQARASEGFRR